MVRRVILAIVASMTIACGGYGGDEKQVPNPLGPGEVANIAVCGSTTEPRSPCGDQQDNIIQLRVGGNTGATCPCFNFTIGSLAVNDLGTTGNNGTTTYDISGFRPGNYTLTGQTMTRSINFKFSHNTSTSTIGVVPSSLQITTGPAATPFDSCSLSYSVQPNAALPAAVAFNFTVAAAASGGSC
jgi:hypothetical protein